MQNKSFSIAAAPITAALVSTTLVSTTQIATARILTTRISTICAVALGMFLGLIAFPVQADTFEWGDIAGNAVTFLDVVENNIETSSLYAPMPGVGGPTTNGDLLLLSPQGFTAQATNNSSDLIDSTLSTIIRTDFAVSLEKIEIIESGDYSLGGVIGGQASAVVGGSFFWTILEIDNAPVSLPPQANNLIFGTGGGTNGGRYKRPGDDGNTVNWNGIATIDLAGYLNSIQVSGEVTSVSLIFDNTLQASAGSMSNAFIGISAITIDVEVGGFCSDPAFPVDCNGDGDVDGADFLEIQRDSPSLISEWQSGYGAGTASSTTTIVPEPGATQLLLLAMVLLKFSRRCHFCRRW